MEKLTDSILLTIKKMLGIAQEYNAFDIDLIVNINSVFLTLNQLGVGPEDPYRIDGAEESWADFLGDQRKNLAGVETYIYQKVRLLFDPPTNSFLVDAMQKQCEEFEWRLRLQAEGGKTNDESASEDVEPERGIQLFSNGPSEAEILREQWEKQQQKSRRQR